MGAHRDAATLGRGLPALKTLDLSLPSPQNLLNLLEGTFLMPCIVDALRHQMFSRLGKYHPPLSASSGCALTFARCMRRDCVSHMWQIKEICGVDYETILL